MKRRIYKYEIPIHNGKWIAPLPVGAQILIAGVQGQGISESGFIWAAVDTEEKKIEGQEIRIVLSGAEPPPTTTFRFLNTLFFDHGSFVIHVFVRLL